VVRDPLPGRPVVPEGSLCCRVAPAGAAQFHDAAFPGMCAEGPAPPSPMLQRMLLALDDRGGAACRHGIRRKYALGLRSRRGWVQGDDRLPVAATVDRQRPRRNCPWWARQRKVVGWNVDELTDATAVWGAGAMQGSSTLIRKARRKLARSLREHPEHGERAKRVPDEPDEKPDAVG
jgi:hypothetical protein